MLKQFTIFILLFNFIFFVACSTSRKPISTDPSILNQQKLPKKLPIPVKGVEKHALNDTWGVSRDTTRTHEGIDILARRGTPVLSTTDGFVMDLKNNNLGGKVVWIRGPSASWHYYAHLDEHKSGLKVGDYVKTGQVIGYVGNTGNAKNTQPHLHYGIYLNGKGRGAVNPYPYLR